VRGRAHVLALSVAVLTVAVPACGGASGPVAVPSDEIPFPLARSPSASPTPAAGVRAVAYMVRDGRLVAVERTVSTSSSPEEAIMRALLDGPTSEERAQGVISAIPPVTGLIGVRVFEGVAEVDLSDEFQGPASPEVVLLRVAQVVWTLGAVSGVNAVRFSIDGDPVSVITDDGVMVDRPVSAPDYASVSPPGAGQVSGEPIVTQP